MSSTGALLIDEDPRATTVEPARIIMRPVIAHLTLLVMLVPLRVTAQEGRAATHEDAEVMNYQLSMEKLRKLVPAQRALNALNAKDPQFFERIDREGQAGGKKNLSVDEQAAILDKYADLKRALASAGTTSREWLLISGAMGNAYMWIETKEGTLETPPPSTAAQKANVDLLEKNDAEFQKIIEELDQLTDEMVSQ
jgi:hypothetical protein